VNTLAAIAHPAPAEHRTAGLDTVPGLHICVVRDPKEAFVSSYQIVHTVTISPVGAAARDSHEPRQEWLGAGC
jgi:hypothetical protein